MTDKTTNYVEEYVPIPKLPKDRPLTNEEKISFELYEENLVKRLKKTVTDFTGGYYGFVFKGKLYTFKYD